MTNFKYEVDQDGIALITWDMPGRSMNVLNADVLAELRKAGDVAERSLLTPLADTLELFGIDRGGAHGRFGNVDLGHFGVIPVR